MTSHLDGEIVTTSEASLLRFERRYDHPIADVWDAITDTERLGRWMFPMTFEKHAGGKLQVDLGELGTVTGRVLVWDEPHKLEYEWQEPAGVGETPDATWHIRFSLRPDGDATVMVFEHLLPDARRPEFAAGWHWYLDRLAALLGGNPPAQVYTDEAFDRLLAGYQEAAGAGDSGPTSDE